MDCLRSIFIRPTLTILPVFFLSFAPPGEDRPPQNPPAIAVDPHGASLLHIPLELPPAIHAPSPAIFHSSLARDGILGPGFSISGMDHIRRLPDKFLQYDADDRFSNSRSSLLAVGNQGANTVYRPEKDDFSRHIAQGTCGSGPCSWLVERKDGERRFYGETENSRLATQTGEIFFWGLLKYQYEPRPDTHVSFAQGAEERTTLRLKNIRITAPGLERNYAFSYEEGKRSLLRSLSRTGWNPGGREDYQPMEFSYSPAFSRSVQKIVSPFGTGRSAAWAKKPVSARPCLPAKAGRAPSVARTTPRRNYVATTHFGLLRTCALPGSCTAMLFPCRRIQTETAEQISPV